ncbi:hypothetical protein C4566_01205 [Candidatus Parcubacteria bacterium]|nr:MAG: hypothetical protein C4566_01205 [Candidatus Parcubacteria bacterium]
MSNGGRGCPLSGRLLPVSTSDLVCQIWRVHVVLVATAVVASGVDRVGAWIKPSVLGEVQQVERLLPFEVAVELPEWEASFVAEVEAGFAQPHQIGSSSQPDHFFGETLDLAIVMADQVL